MNYFRSYSLLTAELKFQTIDTGLCEEQSKNLLKRGLDENPDLKPEIFRSFDDPDFSWMEILNHPDIGEVIDVETEDEAREFAAEMFLKPAMS
jgi:hypothetical protein